MNTGGTTPKAAETLFASTLALEQILKTDHGDFEIGTKEMRSPVITCPFCYGAVRLWFRQGSMV